MDELVKKFPDSVKPVKINATSEDDIKAAVAQIEKESGKLDVAVANAVSLITSYSISLSL